MSLSGLFIFFSWFVGALILLHSWEPLRYNKFRVLYYAAALMTLALSTGVFLARDWVTLLAFWGSLLVLLYGLLAFGSLRTASKGLLIVGIGDFSLLLGIVLLMTARPGTSLSSAPIATDQWLPAWAFLLIAFGAMIKGGIFGFHGWIVDAAQTNPVTTLALLPASLDKFLGVYLLVRAFKDFFVVTPALSVIVMAVGALTILLAVLMALVQHDLKKLLAYHAVSQVGYMILGVASGTLLGMAGGLFHMLNNTIYKSSLFLSAGNIEYRTGQSELDRLGGLSKGMPVTFVSTLIASLAISGVPPLNGFASKWMIYQGLLPQDASTPVGLMKVVFLVIAMFGSALTMASFIKVIYAVFLSPAPTEMKTEVREVPLSMQVPVMTFSLACVAFGVLVYPLVVRDILGPALGVPVESLGFWQPGLATGLMILALAVGWLIFRSGQTKALARPTETFVGGERLEGNRILGTDFYLTVQEVKPLQAFYKLSGSGLLEMNKVLTNLVEVLSAVLYYGVDRLTNLIVNGVGKLVFVISAGLKAVHNGLLDRYVSWILLGLVVIWGVLFKCWNCM